jgi:hypothetical protein
LTQRCTGPRLDPSLPLDARSRHYSTCPSRHLHADHTAASRQPLLARPAHPLPDGSRPTAPPLTHREFR